MRFILCSRICLSIAVASSAQATASAAEYADSYRQLADSLGRCQSAISRIGDLEKALGKCGPRPAPDAVRGIIHELAGQIAVLSAECRQIRSAITLGCQGMKTLSETCRQKAAESAAAASETNDDVIRQQQLSLSRQYRSVAEAMSTLDNEWQAIGKKLDRYAAFLAQSSSVALQWEKMTDLMPVVGPDESNHAVSQAKTTASQVAKRFDFLPKLAEDLPHLQASLSVLGHSVSVASDVPMPGPHAIRPARSLPGKRLTTVEELTRTGWLTAYPSR
jgi:hypothetical protein